MPLVLPFSPYHAIKSRKLTVFWVSVTREFKLFVSVQTIHYNSFPISHPKSFENIYK